MRISTGIIATLAAAGTVLIGTGTAATATTSEAGAAQRCAAARPGYGFYAGGRVASTPVTVPVSACSTISVSHIRDVADPGDRCQTFLVAFLDDGGGVTSYTDPVEACSAPPGRRTVLATGVPDGAVFRVLYAVDYIEPAIQRVGFTVWR